MRRMTGGLQWTDKRSGVARYFRHIFHNIVQFFAGGVILLVFALMEKRHSVFWQERTSMLNGGPMLKSVVRGGKRTRRQRKGGGGRFDFFGRRLGHGSVPRGLMGVV